MFSKRTIHQKISKNLRSLESRNSRSVRICRAAFSSEPIPQAKPWERPLTEQETANRYLVAQENVLREKIKKKQIDQSSLLEFWKQYGRFISLSHWHMFHLIMCPKSYSHMSQICPYLYCSVGPRDFQMACSGLNLIYNNGTSLSDIRVASSLLGLCIYHNWLDEALDVRMIRREALMITAVHPNNTRIV